MASEDLKIGDAKAMVVDVNNRIESLLNSLSKESGLFIERVNIDPVSTEDGVVKYIVKLDTRLEA